MTVEHLPPRATGNDSPVTLYNEQEGVFVVMKSFAGGHAIPSLCLSCNNGASGRGLPQAYTAWREDVIGHLRALAAAYQHRTGGGSNDVWALCRPNGSAFEVPMEHGKGGLDLKRMMNLHPGRIARQVLGMTLALQADRRLLDNFPQLQSAYFSDQGSSIEPFSLHVALANAGSAYWNSSAMSVTIELGTGRSTGTELWMISFSPFIMFLVNGPEPPITATRIDHWLGYPVSTCFGKRERHVTYRIANQRELLVAKLYDDLEKMRTG